MDTRHNGFCRSETTVKISILWLDQTTMVTIVMKNKMAAETNSSEDYPFYGGWKAAITFERRRFWM